MVKHDFVEDLKTNMIVAVMRENEAALRKAIKDGTTRRELEGMTKAELVDAMMRFFESYLVAVGLIVEMGESLGVVPKEP